ncbi:MAG: hypothetical protein J0I43_10450 [Microbacterium sp.]|uniref:HipA N-terminal domain-containing protein n=1 Tax=Microbacterium sp. TaxID=51671 RepID=UPI001AC6F722|nr:HipA N-terminal domain-containing protein [Microbacterium sp.]MBN9177774.1 hypothetical protein [Microbacterium sp.]
MTETLEVFLAGRRVGSLTATRNRRVVEMEWDEGVDAGGIRISESFAAVPGLSPDRTRLSLLLGGYLPEGTQRCHQKLDERFLILT